MGKYKAIAVIYGSDSSESEVSCRSGEFVASRIDGSRYDVYQIYARFGVWQLVAYKKCDAMAVSLPEGSRPEIDKTDFSINILGEKVKFDFAYIVQHGAPGENGEMQGYLEMLGVHFSTCDAAVSSIAFDKYACKSYIRNLGIVKCAPDTLVRKGHDVAAVCAKAASELRFPVFAKPTIAGSSFGITKVKEAKDLQRAVEFGFSEGNTVLVEQGISGREFTCAAYENAEGVHTLPIIEIVTENDYFDYDAKYNGHSQELCPAPIDDQLAGLISDTTKKIYSYMGCAGIVRMDYIYSESEGLYFLEINTVPGMTSASLVPKMVRAAGLDITEFLTGIIEHN